MSSKKDFLKLIKEQRAEKKTEKFSGTFLEYLELVKDNPSLTKLAHRRLCDAIEKHGVSEIPESDPRHRKIFNSERVKVYDYFTEDFFGMERVISKLMRFLKSASL